MNIKPDTQATHEGDICTCGPGQGNKDRRRGWHLSPNSEACSDIQTATNTGVGRCQCQSHSLKENKPIVVSMCD